ncbi:hypothetical protein HH310_37770 [Actinoplanes sp. TBRC 11911]|uniref:ATP-binding protein n=1 Tax=Actinoplanes sp. TBRC 11911 TaxID=2729386 RepID=UPI00145E08E3|nr:ATP-binding protein [Actinoplanes sp. TBRC 11911]NMO56910.1 hypothetical protein [Actinoplanes sp. TBRC 11911]
MARQEHAGARLEQYLRFARNRAFVGREAEMESFRAALTGDCAFTFRYIHGPGGIGKSTLLRRFAAEAERAGRPIVRMDRYDPIGVVAAVLAAQPLSLSGTPGPVLLFDEFEQWQQAEMWLREEFLPGLPVGTVVVFAGRGAPTLEWTADPGWHEVLRVIRLGELAPAEAEALLDHESVPRARLAFLLDVAGGHPLALRLAAEAAAAGLDDDQLRLHLAQALVRKVIGELPSAAHREAVEVAAYADLATEKLLRATVADGDQVTLLRWLCDLPYAETTSEGVRMRPYVRHAIRAELRWRDPARDEVVRSRIESAGAAEPLTRTDFEAAVRDALRAWRRPDLLAVNSLVHSRMVTSVDAHGDRAETLRGVLRSALDAMGEDPRELKAYRALTATYLGTAPTQEAAAERLGLPFSTYRRHLNRGLEVLNNLLWRRETFV